MSNTYFITGTDTEVGKTFVSCALLARADQRGLKTMAFKPVSAGAEKTQGGLRNDDACALMTVANLPLDYHQVNPFCYEPAIAPHIAAAQCGHIPTVERICEDFKQLQSLPHDVCLVEGAGGWRVPLNSRESFSDIPRALGMPVIMVVAMRLGCINHARLTAEAITADGLRLAGWVANSVTSEVMSHYEQNLEALKMLLPAPLLGQVPFSPGDPTEAARFLRLPDRLEGDDFCG